MQSSIKALRGALLKLYVSLFNLLKSRVLQTLIFGCNNMLKFFFLMVELCVKLYAKFCAELCAGLYVKFCVEFYAEFCVKLYAKLCVRLCTKLCNIFIVFLLQPKIKVCLSRNFSNL